jgi:muconolactone delta-isomerase
MKFLVLWSLEIRLLSAAMTNALLRQQDQFNQLDADGKLVARYHIPGRHGGALIFEVASPEELDRLLAAFPVYNMAHFEVYPLAEMQDPTQLMADRGE